MAALAHLLGISIHALREEGDLAAMLPPPPFFLISIHALREEGDLQGSWDSPRC